MPLSAHRLAVATAFIAIAGALVAGPSHAQDSGVMPQLQTDGQRFSGGGDAPQIQSDNGRRAARQQAMAAQGGAGMMMGGGYPSGGGYPGQDGSAGMQGMQGYGAQGYGMGGQGMGASLGDAAAVDVVNAAAGMANRAILRGNGGQLSVGSDGVIRNDGQDGGDAGGYGRRGR